MNTDDQRKRMLDALERRFAFAKAELHQQPNFSSNGKNEMQFRKESDVKTNACAPNPTNPPEVATMASSAPFQDSSRRRTRIDQFLHELLQRGDSAQKYVQGSRVMKLDNVILLDNYVQKHNSLAGAHLRALRFTQRGLVYTSMKNLKKHGIFSLPQDLRKFDQFKPMQDSWRGYIVELLRISGKNQLEQCFLDADLHGAIILVADCKVTSYAGARGMMIRETAETFGIITEDNKLLVVPKLDSVFTMQVDCWKVTTHGDKLIARDLDL